MVPIRSSLARLFAAHQKSSSSDYGTFANDVASGFGSQNYYDPDRALFQRDLSYEMYGPGAATGSMAAGTRYGDPTNPYSPGPGINNNLGTFGPGGQPLGEHTTTGGGPDTVGGFVPGRDTPLTGGKDDFNQGTPTQQGPTGDPTLPGGGPTGGPDPITGWSSRTPTSLGGRAALSASKGSGAGLSGRDALSGGAPTTNDRTPITRTTGTRPPPQVVPFRNPTYDDITNPIGGGAPGGGGPGGGMAGQRDAAGAQVLGGLSGMLQNPEIAQGVKNAIQQEGGLTTQAAFAGAGGDIRRNAAATGNTAGTAAALAQLGRNEGGALGDLSRRNAISFENEAQRRRETALQGLSNYYGQTSSNFNTLAGLRGMLAGTPVGSQTGARNLTKGYKKEDQNTTGLNWV